MPKKIAFFVLLFFCPIWTPSILAEEAPDKAVIGAALALTGSAATWGVAEERAIQFAIEDFQNAHPEWRHKIELIVEDAASSNSKTVSAVQKLINIDGVKVIIGPTWVDSYPGAIPIAKRKNVLMITPSASITAINPAASNPIIFSTYHRTSEQTKQLFKHFADNKFKSVALIFQQDPFGQEIADYAADYAKQQSIEIVSRDMLPLEMTDFKPLLIKLRKKQPDAVFFGFSAEASLLAFLKQRIQVPVEAFFYSTESFSDYWAKPEFKNYVEKARFIAPQVADSSFQERYKARFGSLPVFSASNAYDAAICVLEGIRQGHTSAADLADFLRYEIFNTKTFGPVGFDQFGGVTGGSFAIKEITPNGFLRVD